MENCLKLIFILNCLYLLGRHFFYPVVGLTHSTNSTFKLDGTNLSYPNVSKGAILYAENVSRQQLDECTKLLIQTRSTDLAVILYELPKTLVSSVSLNRMTSND